MAELKATISAEAVMNKALHQLAIDFFNDYQIRIDTVEFRYRIVESIGEKPQAIQATVEMKTTYMPEGDV